MDLRNPLTKKRADDTYLPIEDILRRDMNDNATERIVVGEVGVDGRIEIEYRFQLPVSEKAQTGWITILHDTEGIGMNHRYCFSGSELDEALFSAEVSGSEIRLVIECSGLGENPTLLYRLRSIPVL